MSEAIQQPGTYILRVKSRQTWAKCPACDDDLVKSGKVIIVTAEAVAPFHRFLHIGKTHWCPHCKSRLDIQMDFSDTHVTNSFPIPQ